ncbi:MAG: glutaredoxin domain-containing protein [Nitrosarchaeum sp.]|jgi:glutaredoxin|nr:glutaredoxin domain-containing protein [Nitrosarchaeum sp.]
MTFVVYSKRLCPYCSKIEQILDHVSTEKGHSTIIYELGTDFNKEQFYAEFGEGSTFPQVVCDEKHLGGCSDTIKHLQEHNML